MIIPQVNPFHSCAKRSDGSMLRSTLDADKLANWLSLRQNSDGGFSCGEGVNRSYVDDTYWACATLKAVGELGRIDVDRAIDFVLANEVPSGGFLNKYGQDELVPWTGATAIFFLDLFNDLELCNVGRQINYFAEVVRNTQHRSYLSWDIYHSAVALQALSYDFSEMRDLVLSPTLQREVFFADLENPANYSMASTILGCPNKTTLTHTEAKQLDQFLTTGVASDNTGKPNLLATLSAMELSCCLGQEPTSNANTVDFIKQSQSGSGGLGFRERTKEWCGCAFYALVLLEHLKG